MNDHQRDILSTLGILKFATRLQLSKLLKPQDYKKSGKKLVDAIMYGNGVLMHTLYDKPQKQDIPFYSLTPLMATELSVEEHLELEEREILKQLLLTQLYVTFKMNDPDTTIHFHPAPFDAVFTVYGIQFRVAIARGDMAPLIKFLEHYDDNSMKILISVEELSQAKGLLGLKVKKNSFRIITDYWLLRSDLSQGFCFVNDEGEWEQENIPLFRPKIHSVG